MPPFFTPREHRMLELNKKTVLITGATGALGRATAKIFSNADTKLVLTGRNPEKLSQLAQSLPHNTITQACDLCDAGQVKKLVQLALDKFGRIDVLLNIAGGFSMGPQVHELNEQDFEDMFSKNFTSTLNTCKVVIPIMLTQGSGKIVNVSARAASEGKAKMAPYCISKRAVVTLTECLAAEHKQNNLNINCILPGTIDTDTNRNDMPNANHATWVPPEDIANMMLFLSSDHALSVNGAIIPVYGKS